MTRTTRTQPQVAAGFDIPFRLPDAPTYCPRPFTHNPKQTSTALFDGHVMRETKTLEFDLQPCLPGELVTLEPLRPNHYEHLYLVAADPGIWAQHPVPNRYEEECFRSFFEESLQSGGALAVRDIQTEAIIGSKRFHGVAEETSAGE